MTIIPQKSPPFVDNRILKWQWSLCENPLTWLIYWEIVYLERQKNGCIIKPTTLQRDLNVKHWKFWFAVKLGEKLGLFRRVGKEKSHLGRRWVTSLRLVGFIDGKPIIDATGHCAENRTHVFGKPNTDLPSLCGKPNSHISNTPLIKETYSSVCRPTATHNDHSLNLEGDGEGENQPASQPLQFNNSKSPEDNLLDLICSARSAALFPQKPYPVKDRDLQVISKVARHPQVQEAANALISSRWLDQQVEAAQSRGEDPRYSVAMSLIAEKLESMLKTFVHTETAESVEYKQKRNDMYAEKFMESQRQHQQALQESQQKGKQKCIA